MRGYPEAIECVIELRKAANTRRLKELNEAVKQSSGKLQKLFLDEITLIHKHQEELNKMNPRGNDGTKQRRT
jgi:hypothetical protein